MRFTRSETCSYIASHTAELAKLADAAKLSDLAYILRMAELEARNSLPHSVPIKHDAA